MPSRKQQKKDYRKTTSCLSNASKLKAAAKSQYEVSPEIKKAASRSLYSVAPDKKKAASRAVYSANPTWAVQKKLVRQVKKSLKMK